MLARSDEDNSDPWVLVVDSGSGQNRSALAAVRALALAGYRPAVTVSTRSALAAVSRYCSRVVLTPRVDKPAFAAALGVETSSHAYLGVMPASDAAIVALAPPEMELIDKEKLAKRARDVGMRVPEWRVFDNGQSLCGAAEELNYPLVVKPSFKVNAVYPPARRIESSAGLRAYSTTTGPWIVQPYLEGEMRSLAGVMWQGSLVVAVHQRHERIWPPICGDACVASTVAPDEDFQHRVERLLATYNGVFQAERVGDYLLDVNPRVYGSLPLAIAAGANLPGVYWDLVRGLPASQITPRLGVTYHWWEGDSRNVLSRWRAGDITALQAARAIRSPSSLSNLRELFDDPRPVISRMRYAGASRRASVQQAHTGREGEYHRQLASVMASLPATQRPCNPSDRSFRHGSQRSR